MEEKNNVENNEISFAEMLGMKFKEDGSLESMTDTGNTKVYRKLNHKERRIQAAIERRNKKRIAKWGK